MSGEFQVGPWLVQPALCRLSRDGRSTRIRAKLMDLLVYLAEHPNQVVSKHDLLNQVWQTEAVSESALTRSITELRQALEDSVHDPQIIETISKRGYRLIAPVSSMCSEALPRKPNAVEQSATQRVPFRSRRIRWWVAGAAILFIAVGMLTVVRTKAAAERKAPTRRPWFEHAATRSPRALRSYILAASLMPERSEEAKPHLLDALREDPEFASAHILLAYALSNTLAQPSAYVPHAEMALRFSANSSPAERHFIVASVLCMRADQEPDVLGRRKNLRESISEYEAAIALQPDNVWAIENVAGVYAELGRRNESARAFLRLAELQPASFTVQVQAASRVLESSGAAAARPQFARAFRLLESGAGRDADPGSRQFVELFPAHEAWLNRRGLEAAALTDDAVARQQDRYDDRCWFRLGEFRLALGQLHQAEEAFGRVKIPDLRSLGFATLAIAREDHESAVSHLEAYGQHWDLSAVSLAVRAEDLSLASRLLRNLADVPSMHLKWANEEIREAEGDEKVVQAALVTGAPWADVMAGVRTFMYSVTLARAGARLGYVEHAIRVLSLSDRLRDATLTGSGHSGYFCLRNQLLLADLYSARGQDAEARAIYRALRGALAAADADLPLRSALKTAARRD
jgi:DNA-binding winged helix-turn-helix (wHTH) protein/tetratricopeptide (TPR) repeat protein